MIDIRDFKHLPSLEEISEYVKNKLFDEFCLEISNKYKINPRIEFSKCSWEYGWNVKYKKSGKSLCTIYPRENYFTVLVVVGKKEKEEVENFIPEFCLDIQEIYHQTKAGNGQKWLMVDLEDLGTIYNDVLKLIDVRYQSR